MSKLDDINKDMKQCQSEIDSYNSEVKKLERKCDRLIEFGEKVKYSQGNFSSVLSRDKSCLSKTSAIAKNNHAIKDYKEGMNAYVSNTGHRVVTNIYGKLIDRINAETVKLINKIDGYKSRIHKCNNKMNKMKDDYKKEKKKEEEKKEKNKK